MCDWSGWDCSLGRRPVFLYPARFKYDLVPNRAAAPHMEVPLTTGEQAGLLSNRSGEKLWKSFFLRTSR